LCANRLVLNDISTYAYFCVTKRCLECKHRVIANNCLLGDKSHFYLNTHIVASSFNNLLYVQITNLLFDRQTKAPNGKRYLIAYFYKVLPHLIRDLTVTSTIRFWRNCWIRSARLIYIHKHLCRCIEILFTRCVQLMVFRVTIANVLYGTTVVANQCIFNMTD